jgi:hypothetical protein
LTTTLAVHPTGSPSACLPTIRVVPAPRSEPPSDDELLAAGIDGPTMGAPLLPFDLPGSTRRGERGRPALLRLPGTAPAPVDGEAPLPSPAKAATRLFLATCVEVIGGFRPMGQLRPLCVPQRYGDIATRLATHPATTPGSRTGTLAYLAGRTPITGRDTGAPPRTPRNHQTSPGDRTNVRRVQICDIGPGVAEVATVLCRREQVWAMALRFELHRDRWLCSLLEVI